MKKSINVIQKVSLILFVLFMSMASVFAASNVSDSTSGDLSAVEVAGGFVLLVFAILIPLVKSRPRIRINR